jgi:tetratricopeptide (TPR) repeat protein
MKTIFPINWYRENHLPFPNGITEEEARRIEEEDEFPFMDRAHIPHPHYKHEDPAFQLKQNAVTHLNALIEALDPFKPKTVEDLFNACFDFKNKGEIRSEQHGPENLLAAAGALSNTLRRMEELNIPESREPAFYNNVSLLFDEVGDNKQALAMAIKAAELQPNVARRSFWVACLYEEHGPIVEKVRWLHRTLDIDPTHLQARLNLAYNYWRCGYFWLAQHGFKTVVAFADEEQCKVSKEMRFSKRMIQYLEKKMELFGPEDEGASCMLDLEKIAGRK